MNRPGDDMPAPGRGVGTTPGDPCEWEWEVPAVIIRRAGLWRRGRLPLAARIMFRTGGVSGELACVLFRSDLTVAQSPLPGAALVDVATRRPHSVWFGGTRRVHHLEPAGDRLGAVFVEVCHIALTNQLMDDARAAGWRVQMPRPGQRWAELSIPPAISQDWS